MMLRVTRFSLARGTCWCPCSLGDVIGRVVTRAHWNAVIANCCDAFYLWSLAEYHGRSCLPWTFLLPKGDHGKRRVLLLVYFQLNGGGLFQANILCCSFIARKSWMVYLILMPPGTGFQLWWPVSLQSQQLTSLANKKSIKVWCKELWNKTNGCSWRWL